MDVSSRYPSMDSSVVRFTIPVKGNLHVETGVESMEDNYNSSERRKARFEQRLHNYGMAVVLLVALAFLAINDGLVWELVILKAAAIPLFVMSLGFLSAEYTSEQSKTPWTSAHIEKSFLYGISLAAFATVFAWSPDKPAASMIWQIGIAVVGFSLVLPSILWLARRLSLKRNV